MPFRFRKSIGITKGVRLNLGKKGASISVGGKGASLNINKRGTRTTVGIPGTGLSYSESSKSDSNLGDFDLNYENRSNSLNWLSLFVNGLGLIGSLISFLFSCVIAAFAIYFLILVLSS